MERCKWSSSSLVLVHDGLAALLLVLGTRSVGRDGALELSSLSDTLALLGLLGLLGDLGRVVGLVVGQALLLSRHLVEALGLLVASGLRMSAW